MVLIGIPNGSGMFPTSMVSSLLQLHKPVQCAFMVVERQMIERARNMIALEAIKNNVSHLLFLDDDNPVPPNTLELMLEDDKDIVIAPILSRTPDSNGNHHLCAFNQLEVEGEILYLPIERLNGEFGHLHKIDSGGTGCMLIKTDVLVKLSEIYGRAIFERTKKVFEKPITYNGQQFTERTMSEDVEFCERAVNAGFEIWLDDRVRPLHITSNKYVQWQNMT